MNRLTVPLALAALLLSGCTGRIGAVGETEGEGEGNRPPGGHGLPGGGGGGSQGGAGSQGGNGAGAVPGEPLPPVSFECDGAAVFSTPPMRRLSKRQYTNTLTDLVTATVGEGEASSVLGSVAAALESLPGETRKQVPEDLHGSYRRLDQDVAQAHVDGWYEIATTLGTALTTPALLGRVAGTCAADPDASNDAACVDSFVRTFGERAFRRPLTDEQVTLHRAFYGTSSGIDPLGFADVIGGLLSAPQFLYVIEHGGEERADRPGVFRLDAFEVAARLSYHFWETAPDLELLDAARTGALLDLAEYQIQVERLFRAPRTRVTLREFTRDWLKLEDLSDLDRNVGNPVYRAFASDTLPGPDLRDHMIDEVLDFVDYYTWTVPGTMADLLTANVSFARTDDLAAIYDAPVWSGDGAPPALPDGERPGLLSRAALLATGTAMTRPIMRGVFMRRNVLCDEIPPPPDNAAAMPPELSPTLSTRQVVEQLTQTPDTACAGCHGAYINPLGFAFEGFDALGRLRAEQPLFDAAGALVGSVPVDTSTVPRVRPSDREASTGARDVVRQMLASGKPQACLARHYFRFTFGRWEDEQADGCVLESLRTSLTESGNFASMLRDAVTTDAFRERTFD